MSQTSKRFYGQQEDELVLYEIRPHWVRKSIAAISGLIVALVSFRVITFVAYVLSLSSDVDHDYVDTAGTIISLIFGLLIAGWLWYAADSARAFITDRRFVRMELAFPIFVNSRSLFWNEVLKVKGFAPNIFMRLAKIGTLRVQPLMSESGREDVQFRFVYYFGDIANYIDKILFTYKTKPEEVKNIRPFVARPAGERY